MKKIVIIFFLTCFVRPVSYAKPTNSYPLTTSQSKTKIYSSNGASYQGYVKTISPDRYAVYNKYDQKEQTYKVKNNKVYVDKYIQH